MYLTKIRLLKELEKFRVGGGGGAAGCIWIIASALWSRVLRIRLVNELKCIRPDLDLDQELDNFNNSLHKELFRIYFGYCRHTFLLLCTTNICRKIMLIKQFKAILVYIHNLLYTISFMLNQNCMKWHEMA